MATCTSHGGWRREDDMTEHVVETRAPRRAKQILNGLIQSRAMTPSGLKWLEVATDPFHDTEIRSDGYPDMIATRSIVQTVTKTITVNAPAGPTNWDMHVWFAPLTPTFTQDPLIPIPPMLRTTTTGEGNEDLKTKRKRKISSSESETEDGVGVGALHVEQGYHLCGVNYAGKITPITGRTTVWPGWNAISITGGGNWLTSAGEDHNGICLPRDYASGSWRLIGTGLEVVNTTAQLYKGGSVTAYRSPCPISDGTYYVSQSTSDAPSYTSSTRTGVTPPFTQADAALYPNSKTWAAEEGVYSIATLNSIDNPYYTPKPSMGGLIIPRSQSDLESGAGWLGFFPISKETEASIPWPNSSLTTTLPFDIAGAIFTGLNAQSALQVTVRYYIERNPTVADPNLLVLARTPCPYDPTAMEIYTRCMEDLPVGVPVRMNPLGEWFTEVLKGIGEWAPKVGNALGNIVPGAGIIGNIVGTAANGIQLARGTKVVERVKPNGTVQVTTTKKAKKRKRKRPNTNSSVTQVKHVSGLMRAAPPRRRRK